MDNKCTPAPPRSKNKECPPVVMKESKMKEEKEREEVREKVIDWNEEEMKEMEMKSEVANYSIEELSNEGNTNYVSLGHEDIMYIWIIRKILKI